MTTAEQAWIAGALDRHAASVDLGRAGRCARSGVPLQTEQRGSPLGAACHCAGVGVDALSYPFEQSLTPIRDIALQRVRAVLAACLCDMRGLSRSWPSAPPVGALGHEPRVSIVMEVPSLLWLIAWRLRSRSREPASSPASGRYSSLEQLAAAVGVSASTLQRAGVNIPRVLAAGPPPRRDPTRRPARLGKRKAGRPKPEPDDRGQGQGTALPEGWEMVVGLEVHVELDTATKLFCGCANRFGDEPNTNVCPVCMGLPGSLPVLNAAAVDSAMRMGRALGCDVKQAVFARKHYFYPDIPKGYQISQYDQPTNTDGLLELPDGHVVGVERAHIEEDTAKTTHVGGSGRIHGADYALVDYNRAGVPLVEVVSRPDIRTAEQARSCVRELCAVLTAVGVSDARMQDGSVRVDANVSVRPAGSDEMRTRCEIKNLNSLRSLGRAIDFEARRHIGLWTSGGQPRQQTRHWDEAQGCTTPGRTKEDAEDYRYFPEPDLLSLTPSDQTISFLDAELPPMPSQRRAELVAAGGGAVSTQDAAVLVERGQDGLVRDAIAADADPALTVTRTINDLPADTSTGVTSAGLAALIAMESDGRLTATQAKQVLAEMAASQQAPEEIAARHGFHAMASDDLAGAVDRVIADNHDEWGRFCAGDSTERKKMAGFLTGRIMRATKGKADGAAVARLLSERSRPAQTPTRGR